jgi:AcrR family transcriptional regulator
MAINNEDSRVKRTKKLIRQGLVELAVTKRINKITVKELTDHIEINRGTFYLHYKDVYDLVDSLENELYNDFNTKLSSYTGEALLMTPVDVCEDFCKHFYEHKDLYSTFLGVNGDAHFAYKLGERLNERVFDIFKSIFPNMDDTKYDFTYNYCKFGLIGLVTCWFTEHPEWTPRQIAEMWLHLTTLGIWGILSDEGKEVLLNAKRSR